MPDSLPDPQEPSPFRGDTPVGDRQRMLDDAQTEAIAIHDQLLDEEECEMARLRQDVEDMKREVSELRNQLALLALHTGFVRP